MVKLNELKWEPHRKGESDRKLSEVLVPLPRWHKEFPQHRRFEAYRVVKWNDGHPRFPGGYTVRTYATVMRANRGVDSGVRILGPGAGPLEVSSFLDFMEKLDG